MKWVLVLVMYFGVGPAREPLEIRSTVTYDDLEACQMIGQRAAAWLTQDFVTVEPRCLLAN